MKPPTAKQLEKQVNAGTPVSPLPCRARLLLAAQIAVLQAEMGSLEGRISALQRALSEIESRDFIAMHNVTWEDVQRSPGGIFSAWEFAVWLEKRGQKPWTEWNYAIYPTREFVESKGNHIFKTPVILDHLLPTMKTIPNSNTKVARRWVDWASDACENCGGAAEIFTEEEEGFARDGDAARCVACGMNGGICCDSESPAVIMWEEDDDAPNVSAVLPLSGAEAEQQPNTQPKVKYEK